MRFRELYSKFKLNSDYVEIEMDHELAKGLSTIDALKFSIKKFKKALAIIENLPKKDVVYFDFGIPTCPLCSKFLVDAKRVCIRCPVYKRTYKEGCADTPYDDVSTARTVGEYIPALKDEISFLESLLEDEK